MILTKKDEREMKDYFINRIVNNDINIYMMSYGYDSLKNINVKNLEKHNFDIRELERKLLLEPDSIDIIIYNYKNNYNIALGQKLRVLTKKASLISRKNITTAYNYLEDSKNKVKLFYETPTYSHNEIIQTEYLTDMEILDLACLKHDINNGNKEIPKTLKYVNKKIF